MIDPRTKSVCKNINSKYSYGIEEHIDSMKHLNSLAHKQLMKMIQAQVASEEGAVETMLSCVCAGVPMSEIEAQCFSDYDYRNHIFLYDWHLLFYGEKPLAKKSKIISLV